MATGVAQVEGNPFNLARKSAAVTGGAMGIGFGIAKQLAEAGANVLIADINGEAAEKAARKLAGLRGEVGAVESDITLDGAGERIVRKCDELFGSLDILVNDAGIYPMSPVLQMTPEFFDRVYRVNLRGLVFASKAAAAKMVERGRGGKIINIASIDAFHPSSVGLAAYDATKGGVVMFTKALALEVAKYGINVNSIAPGIIPTEGTSKPIAGLTKAQIDQMMSAMVAKIPLGRTGTPDDIGRVALFLASSASDYMTGQTLVVDGGILLS